MPRSIRVVNSPSSPSSSSPPPLEAHNLKAAIRTLTRKYKTLRKLTRKQKIQKAKKVCKNYSRKIRNIRGNLLKSSKNVINAYKAAGSKFIL